MLNGVCKYHKSSATKDVSVRDPESVSTADHVDFFTKQLKCEGKFCFNLDMWVLCSAEKTPSLRAVLVDLVHMLQDKPCSGLLSLLVYNSSVGKQLVRL